MLIRSYISIHNKREPIANMDKPGCEPKIFAYSPLMEQMCSLLDQCTPQDEKTEVCFTDTLEITFSTNFDKRKFITESKQIFGDSLINDNALQDRMEAKN